MPDHLPPLPIPAKQDGVLGSAVDAVFRRRRSAVVRLIAQEIEERPSRDDLIGCVLEDERGASLDEIVDELLAQSGARSKQTLKHLDPQTRTALGKEANAVRRGDQPTRKELEAQARRLNISGRSKMGKAELKRAVAAAS
jgi:hypothetical protein